jgi:hypothetical protein
MKYRPVPHIPSSIPDSQEARAPGVASRVNIGIAKHSSKIANPNNSLLYMPNSSPH